MSRSGAPLPSDAEGAPPTLPTTRTGSLGLGLGLGVVGLDWTDGVVYLHI